MPSPMTNASAHVVAVKTGAGDRELQELLRDVVDARAIGEPGEAVARDEAECRSQRRPRSSPRRGTCPRIVCRVAPIARSIPMSRRRSETTVRNVFRMMKAPIASAKRPIRLMAFSLTCSDANSWSDAPRPPILKPSPRRRLTVSATTWRSAPGRIFASITLMRPPWMKSCCAAPRGMYTDSAPGAPGTAAMPTTRNVVDPSAPGSSNASPTPQVRPFGERARDHDHVAVAGREEPALRDADVAHVAGWTPGRRRTRSPLLAGASGPEERRASGASRSRRPPRGGAHPVRARRTPNVSLIVEDTSTSTWPVAGEEVRAEGADHAPGSRRSGRRPA